MSQVCRTCLEVYENGCQLFSLEINEPTFDRIHIKTKLEACVPEIALHRVRNSAICRYCLFALNTAYDFKTKCLQTETKIFNYMTSDTIDSNDLRHFIKRNTNNPYNCDTINQNSPVNGESRILLSPISLLPPTVPPYPPISSPQTPLSPVRQALLSRSSLQSQQNDLPFPPRSPFLEGAPQPTGPLFQGGLGPPRSQSLHLSSRQSPIPSPQTPLSPVRQALLSRSSLQSQQNDSPFPPRSPFLEGAPQPAGPLFQGGLGPPRSQSLHLPSSPRLHTGQSSQRLHQVGSSFSSDPSASSGSRFQVRQPFSEGLRFQTAPSYAQYSPRYPPFSQSSSLPTGLQYPVRPSFSEANTRYQGGSPFSQNPGIQYPVRPPFSEANTRYQGGPSFSQGNFRYQVPFPQSPSPNSRLQMGPPLHSIRQYQQSQQTCALFQGGSQYLDSSQLQAKPAQSESPSHAQAASESPVHPNSPQLQPGTFFQGELQQSGLEGQVLQARQPLTEHALQQRRPSLPENKPLPASYGYHARPEGQFFPAGHNLQTRSPLHARYGLQQVRPEGPLQPTGHELQTGSGYGLQSNSQILEGLPRFPEGQPLIAKYQQQIKPPLSENTSIQANSQIQTGSQSSASSVSPSVTTSSFASAGLTSNLTFTTTSTPLFSYRLAENGVNTFILLQTPITRSYKCSICQQCFTSFNLLKEHQNCHINPEGLKCSICDFQTNSTQSLDEHLKSHGRFVPMDTTTTTNTPATTGTSTSESSYKCFNCNYSTTDKNLFKEHRAIHVAEAVHQCGLCNFRSSHSSSLRRHMKVHMGDRPFRCTECRYGAADEVSIQIHMRIHQKERPHKCTECSFSALKRSKLKVHLLKCHGKILDPTENTRENEDHTHGVSPPTDPYQVSLDDIHNILQGEDDFSDPQECATPDLVNGTESDAAHDPYMITVEDIQKILQNRDENDNESTDMESADANTGKVFRCSTCKQQFKYIYLLRRHMATHSSNNKSLKCPRCDFETTIKSQLQVHIKTHTGGKVYRCEKCEYSTIYWSNIQKHHRVHTGEKPYKCTFCDYKASQQATVKTHIMNTHAEKTAIVLNCNQCSFTADTEEELITHIEMHSIGGHFLEDGISNNFIEDSIKRHFALSTVANPLVQDNFDEEPSESPEGVDGDLIPEAANNEPSQLEDLQEASASSYIQEANSATKSDDNTVPGDLQEASTSNSMEHSNPNSHSPQINETVEELPQSDTYTVTLEDLQKASDGNCIPELTGNMEFIPESAPDDDIVDKTPQHTAADDDNPYTTEFPLQSPHKEDIIDDPSLPNENFLETAAGDCIQEANTATEFIPEPFQTASSSNSDSQHGYNRNEDQDPASVCSEGLQEAAPHNFIEGYDTNMEYIPESSRNDCLEEPSPPSNNSYPENLQEDSCLQSFNPNKDYMPESAYNSCIVEELSGTNNDFSPPDFQSVHPTSNYIQEPNANIGFIPETSPNSYVVEDPSERNVSSKYLARTAYRESSTADNVQESNAGINFISESPQNHCVSNTEPPSMNDSFIQEHLEDSFLEDASNLDFIQEEDYITETSNNETSDNSFIDEVFNPSSSFVSESCKDSVENASNRFIEGVVGDNISAYGVNFVPQGGTT